MQQEVLSLSTEERSNGDRSLSTLERAVLRTAVYSDLFDYPLTEDEIFGYLPVVCTDRQELERALASLATHPDADLRLRPVDGYFCLAGREDLAVLRRQRGELAASRWPPARRFGRWLGRLPFVRMVAVCGSQAVENGGRDGDVDLFLVTEEGRLWLVHLLVMVLKRIGLSLGIDLCPNYLLTTTALELETRNLYTAREVTQAVPLWGEGVFDRFLAANPWVEEFLPQPGLVDRRRFVEEPRRGRFVRSAERLLGGRFGAALDRSVHRLLLHYYRWRLRGYGWTRANVEDAYRRDRQMVIHGGFGAAVARRYFDAAAKLGSREELERWFFGSVSDASESTPDPLYAGIMDQRYGSQRPD